MRVTFLLIIILSCIGQIHAQSTESRLDSVIYYRTQAMNPDFTSLRQLEFAKKAVLISNSVGLDSTILNSNRILAFQYINNQMHNLFKLQNEQNLELAVKIKDTSAIAVANHNLGLHNHNLSKNDSAFYFYSQAQKFYKALNNEIKRAEILMNIADLQETERDYVESEKNAISAIKLLERLSENENSLEQLWILNNLIGIISLKLHNYDKSIEYHEKAVAISKRQNENGLYNYLFSLNNQAFVYRKKGNLKKALELYQELLERRGDYDEYDPTFYPLVLNNIAYTKLLDGYSNIDEIESQFLEAVKISDSLQDEVTMLDVSNDITKFYIQQDQKEKALFYAKKSYDLAKKISNNELLLEAMYLLSELTEGETSRNYLKAHIRLSDSLLNEERNTRNKYARIEFEADELEAENKLFSQQRVWLAAIAGGLLLTLALVYVIITQRAKNKELQFVQDQQKANEEIYNLMLSQQDKVDEARANEKKRISQELHDGVLGRLFGTRLSLDSLNFSEGKDAIKSRMQYIDELKTIEQDIRKISHDLNTDFVAGSGFVDILSELIDKQSTAYGLTYDFVHTDDVNWELVPNKTKINIYRVIQESMQNIYKHAQAKHIKIGIGLKNDVICLSVSDDGVGFDLNKSKKGIGLKNINSRIDELAGTVQFASEIGKGTTVDIEIPYAT